MAIRPRLLLLLAAVLPAACRGGPPSFVYPRAPQVTATAVPTALAVNWEIGPPIVEAYVDGRGPWNFILDSGAEPYVIDRRVADELKLARIDLEDVSIPGGWSADRVAVRQVARIDEIRVGPLVERDTGAEIFDLAPIERATGVRIDGIVPAGAFRNCLLTLDFAGQTATVTAGELPPEDDVDVLALDDYGRLPRVEVELGGALRQVLIDTGAGDGLSLPDDLRTSLKFRSPAAVVGKRLTIDGTVPVRAARLDGTIAWGRHRIVDPVVGFTPDRWAVAGVDLLREFRVTFDFSNSRVRFERAGDGPIRSQPERGLGAALLRKGDVWIVTDIVDDGPAAKAGVRVGDRVETIDGKTVAELSRKAQVAIMRTQDTARLRIVGPDGSREVVVPVATFVE